MKVNTWGRGSKKGVMIRLSPREAARVIKSLAAQLEDEDPNANRVEFSPREGPSYLSFAVDWTGLDTVAGLRAAHRQDLDNLRAMYHRAWGKPPKRKR